MILSATDERRCRVGLRMLLNQGVDEDQESTHQRLSTRMITSQQAYEEVLTHSGLSMFGRKNENQKARMDEARSRHTKRYRGIVFELGVEYSEQAKYKDVYGFVRSHGKMMSAAAKVTRNFSAASCLVLGFSGGGKTSIDGQPVFSATHDNANGTLQSNVGSVDLSATELQTALGLLASQLGDRGLPMSNKARKHKLIVSPVKVGDATGIVYSNLLAGTADNNTNKYIRERITEVIDEDYIGWDDGTLDSALQDQWFLMPAEADKNPLFCMRVKDFETRMQQDVRTGNYIMVARFEELWDWLDWRNTWASNP